MRIPWHALLLLTATVPFRTAAQEPVFMEAATHPGRDQFYVRSLFFHEKGKEENRTHRTDSLRFKVAYGLTARTALLLDSGYAVRSSTDRKHGVENSLIRIKQRIHQNDFSPLNTWRTSLNAGVLLPGDGPAAETRPAPVAGLTTTMILGRNGLNGQLQWTGLQENPDRLEANASYAWRLVPTAYAPDTRGAWYLVGESLNDFHTNGDRRSALAIELLYEARRWAAEFGVLRSVSQNTGGITGYTLAAGLRRLF